MAATTDTLRKQHDSQPLATEPAPYTPWREQSVTVKVLSIIVTVCIIAMTAAWIVFIVWALAHSPIDPQPIIPPGGGL